jgi:hypothetical protein
MRFLSSIVCAIIGAIAGAALMFLIAIFLMGDDFGGIFMGLMFVRPTIAATAITGGILGFVLFPRLRDRDTQRLKVKKAVISLSVAASGAVLLAGTLFWIIRSNARPPSDEKLLTNFERHEAELSKLVEMTKAEQGLIQISRDKVSAGIPETRLSDYRQKLKDAHIREGLESKPVFGEIDFCSWAIGSAISPDISKGYTYCERAPAPEIQGTLDEYRPPRDDTVKVYRHIRGNWYLYYEYNPG